MHNKSIYVGIDDFAYKKGKDYMSVVVDQMTHIPIALLEDRNGEALDNWLIRNQMCIRDRSTTMYFVPVMKTSILSLKMSCWRYSSYFPENMYI